MGEAYRLYGAAMGVGDAGGRVVKRGVEWRKCIFTVELRGFTRRSPRREWPRQLRGARVRLVRWCCLDWHHRTGVRLTPEETRAVLRGVLDLTRGV